MCCYGEEAAPIVYFVHNDLGACVAMGVESAPIVYFVHSDLGACVAMGRKLHPF
jgi:hypothetical protein